MFTKVKAWLSGEVQLVEHIVSGFTATITKLEQSAEANWKRALHFEAVKADAQAALDFVHTERVNALAIAARIKTLLS